MNALLAVLRVDWLVVRAPDLVEEIEPPRERRPSRPDPVPSQAQLVPVGCVGQSIQEVRRPEPVGIVDGCSCDVEFQRCEIFGEF